MDWFLISSLAYFLIALEVILDKFLLSSQRISHPAIYAFYSGVLSLFTILLFPFGFHAIAWGDVFYYLFPGFIFAYGILLIFFAIRRSEASRVTPVVGAVIPLATYGLAAFLTGERLVSSQFLGIFLLIAGGLLISWKPAGGSRRNFFKGFYASILAGLILAVSFTLFKKLYTQDNFVNVFIWTRLGFVAGSLSLLIFPWRKMIFLSLKNFQKPRPDQKSSGLLFVFNKILGGTGSILLNFSISLGSVTIINALVSLEYVFVFIFGLLLSLWRPDVFQEEKDQKSIFQKILAIFLIASGFFLISRSL